MSQDTTKIIGITVQRDRLTLVEMEIAPRDADRNAAAITYDASVRLQDGERGSAYLTAKEWLATFLRERSPSLVVVKGSAVSGRGSATLGLLEGAEFRGVVMLAAKEAGCALSVVKKAAASRTFGSRKVDDYVGDDVFWESTFAGELRKGSRETALLAYSAV